MGIYVTGDTHGDISRLLYFRFPGNHIIDENDVVFVLGDFGVIFNNVSTPKETRILNLLANRPFITMIIDGNHENHSRIYNLPETEIFGGKVGEVMPGKVFFCRRGEIYTIEDNKIFTFGGATSIDRNLRVPGVSWWKEEVPSPAEMDHGLKKLEDHGNSVDYIFAHTCPEDISRILIKKLRSFFDDPDPTRKYLEHVCSITSFKDFYCGHWHVEDDIENYHFLYEDIRRVV